MMLEDRKFARAYLSSLKELDTFDKTHPDARLGEKLYFVLKDFVPHLTDWKKEIEEGTAAADLYKRTWARCRNFILPMNPQRTELEFAVRKILSEYGVHVKQSRKKVRMRLPPEE